MTTIRFDLILAIALLGATLTGCKKSGDSSTSQTARLETASDQSPSKAAAGGERPRGAGDAIALRVKWPAGNKYTYRMDLEQRVRMEMPQMPRPMEQNVTMAQTYSLSVVNEQPSGGRELEMTFLAQELEVSMAGQIMMSFDSKADPSEDKDNPFAAPYRSMIGSSLRLVLDASNRVTDVPNLKQWMDKLTAKAPPMAQASLQQMYNPEYFKQLVEFSRSFPPNPVRTGESWSHEQEITAGPMGKFALQTQNTLKGSAQREQRECAVISFTGTMKSSGAAQPGPMGKVSIDKGQMTGTNWFDASLGAVIESNSEQDMELKIEMPAQAGPMAGKSIPGKIRQTVALKLVDLARPGK